MQFDMQREVANCFWKECGKRLWAGAKFKNNNISGVNSPTILSRLKIQPVVLYYISGRQLKTLDKFPFVIVMPGSVISYPNILN